MAGNWHKVFRYIYKTVLFFLMIAFVFVVWNVVPAFFYKPETNRNVLQSYYKKGVYHIHSIFSDGRGDVNKIAEAASQLKLDFLILTDHGRPNVGSSTSTTWNKGVLVVGGSEISTLSGHLASAGFDVPDYRFPVEAQESIHDVVTRNGVCFLAHPDDKRIPWTDWNVKGFTGLEVLSAYSEGMRAGILNLMVFPFKYLVNPVYGVLDAMEYPEGMLKKWDDFNKDGKANYYGIYALDTHGGLEISEDWHLNFPSYNEMFKVMTIYVKVSENRFGGDARSASREVVNSLKRGNFFNVIEGLCSANGFDVYYLEKNSREGNNRKIDMGGNSLSSTGAFVIQLPFSFETRIKIIKDGALYKEFEGNTQKQLEVGIGEKGVYRVEVFIEGSKFKKLPWIITNPFFIGHPTPLLNTMQYSDPIEKNSTQPPLAVGQKIPMEQFIMEKNERTQGDISFTIDDNGGRIWSMRYELGKKESESSYWCSMVMRKDFRFQNAKGIGMDVWAEKRGSYTLELRTGKESKNWYSYSFFADKEWKKVYIPFSRFHIVYSKKAGLDPSKVESMYITINEGTAYEGARGVLKVKNLVKH